MTMTENPTLNLIQAARQAWEVWAGAHHPDSDDGTKALADLKKALDAFPSKSLLKATEHPAEGSTLGKLNKMARGYAQLFRADELAVLRTFDPGEVINFVEVVRFEAWINEKDRAVLLAHLPQLAQGGK